MPLLEIYPDLHLVVVGDGVEGPRLKALVDEMTRAGRVHFAGWRRPVVSDLRDLDLIVCSSKNEGTSVSIIEALVAGIPVVSTRVGGMPDLLENGRWGDLVDYSEAALREGVEIRLGKLKTSETINTCRAAVEHFSHRFSVERLLNEMNSLYLELQQEGVTVATGKEQHVR